MREITEEMRIHKKWYKQAHKITLKELPKFLNNLMSYKHDYGTICHAITAGGLATMHAMDNEPQAGITGFQASCIMWRFITEWMPEYQNTPLRLLNYENLLYPQYEDKFEKIISKDTWEWLQKEAKKKLKERAHPIVKKHWKNIVAGNIPFGFKVED